MYRLELRHTAHRQISRLPWQTQERVNRTIARLAEDPRPPGSKKLTVRDGYRIRVGDYRVLYLVDDNAKLVVIYRVMARGDVYRLSILLSNSPSICFIRKFKPRCVKG